LQWGVTTQTDATGRWSVDLVPNSLTDDPQSFYIVEEGQEGTPVYHVHYIRVPEGVTSVWLGDIVLYDLSSEPSLAPVFDNVVRSLRIQGQALLKGDVVLKASTNVTLVQDNIEKSITINISPQGSGSGLDADTVDGQHASAFAPASHTHTKSQITDLEQITTTPTANAVPKADASGKISVGWIPQGSGSNLDADKLDGLDSTAFERVANKGVANGYAPLDANAKVPVAHIADNLRVATIGLTVGDGVNAITTGFKGAIPVPFAGTITEWTIVSTDTNPPTTGSIEIDILKSTYANYPTMSSMVGTGIKPNISNSNKGNGTPTGWTTTTVNAGDIIGFNVTSVTGLKRITIVLKVLKS